MKKDLNSLLEKRAARAGEILDPEDVALEPDDVDEPEEAAPKSFEGPGLDGPIGEPGVEGIEGSDEVEATEDEPVAE